MNKLEKYATMFVAVVGALTGVWAVYNDYSASEFRKPITLREAKVESFKSQIASAKERGDKEAVLRVSLDYENYEESWRNRLILSSITEPITNLVSIKVSPEQNKQLEQLLKNTDQHSAMAIFEPKAVGSAYLATGNFEKASHYYQLAADLEPSNANIYALRSLAIQGEAQTEPVEEVRQKLVEKATELAEKAKAKGVNSKKLEFLSSELKGNM